MKHLVTALSTALAFLSGCTMVELTPEGRNVAVMEENQITSNCEMTGTTTVSVLDRVIIQRGNEAVAEELEILASNSAAQRGDTIVPASQVVDGTRTYNIYRCRPR